MSIPKVRMFAQYIMLFFQNDHFQKKKCYADYDSDSSFTSDDLCAIEEVYTQIKHLKHTPCSKIALYAACKS